MGHCTQTVKSLSKESCFAQLETNNTQGNQQTQGLARQQNKQPHSIHYVQGLGKHKSNDSLLRRLNKKADYCYKRTGGTIKMTSDSKQKNCLQTQTWR